MRTCVTVVSKHILKHASPFDSYLPTENVGATLMATELDGILLFMTHITDNFSAGVYVLNHSLGFFTHISLGNLETIPKYLQPVSLAPGVMVFQSYNGRKGGAILLWLTDDFPSFAYCGGRPPEKAVFVESVPTKLQSFILNSLARQLVRNMRREKTGWDAIVDNDLPKMQEATQPSL